MPHVSHLQGKEASIMGTLLEVIDIFSNAAFLFMLERKSRTWKGPVLKCEMSCLAHYKNLC